MPYSVNSCRSASEPRFWYTCTGACSAAGAAASSGSPAQSADLPPRCSRTLPAVRIRRCGNRCTRPCPCIQHIVAPACMRHPADSKQQYCIADGRQSAPPQVPDVAMFLQYTSQGMLRKGSMSSRCACNACTMSARICAAPSLSSCELSTLPSACHPAPVKHVDLCCKTHCRNT